MDFETLSFWILFGVVGFLILYASFRMAAWSKYNQVDEKILDLQGEEVEATLISAKKNKRDPKLYDIKLEYVDKYGDEHQAVPATYQKIKEMELKYIKKNQPIRALAYKDVLELDFSEMDESSGDGVETIYSSVLYMLKLVCPVFSPRCGFPPRHPRKQMLKELQRNE